MPRFRDRLPDDMKELIALCRKGQLIAIQRWIAEGRRIHPPEGHYSTTPFDAAVKSGFHSLLEVFLKTGIDQDARDRALLSVAQDGRIDLVELLLEYGADFNAVDSHSVINTRNPVLIRWFIDRGMDLEEDLPITYAFRYRHREFLGIYMDLRNKVPSAVEQATMALRLHARDGNLKWVSLLMWAGVDPRRKVRHPESDPEEEFKGTALEDAVKYTRTDVVRKIGIKPGVDDPTELLAHCWMCNDPALVKMLLDAGADPNGGEGESNPMKSLMRNFRWSFEPGFLWKKPEPAIECLKLAAERGGRWKPFEQRDQRVLRTVLSKLDPAEAIEHLKSLVDTGIFTSEVFHDLMNTPRMKEILNSCPDASDRLRTFAGYKEVAPRYDVAPKKQRSDWVRYKRWPHRPG